DLIEEGEEASGEQTDEELLIEENDETAEQIPDNDYDELENFLVEDVEIDKLLFFSPFTGMPVTERSLEKAIMVSIENTKQARPQSGLESASIIYEFLVEGGITRFMALYRRGLPEKVGPVRSLRPYLIELAQEYNALLLHAGASPEGFAMLKEVDIESLDQLYNGNYYWRSIDRPSPHNLYTGINKISPYLNRITGLEYSDRFPFQHISFVKEDDSKADYIRIHFWGGSRVSYRYDPDGNVYKRFYSLEEKPHLTDRGEQLTARNIIVQYVKTRVIDDIGRLEMELQGNGQALVFRDGILIEGYWEKHSGEWTRFYENNGQEIKLNPGQTWIEVVPTSTNIEYGSEQSGSEELR
ncbi:MAG TPA: DUF3048 domain-containing protein, partial [Halanaerobiales bacterium]|nr:DUF3048 domain-containing protein [Halanaerobiales bacterium]